MAKTKAARASTVSEEKDTPKLMKIREGDKPVRIRSGAGISYSHVDGKYLGKGVFEIDEISPGPGSTSGWGHLANGLGWVALDFVETVH